MTTEADLVGCRGGTLRWWVVGAEWGCGPKGQGSGLGPGPAEPQGDFCPCSRVYWSPAVGLAQAGNLAAGRDGLLPSEKW